ncbi:MAG: XamI family restriction endonuclease [Terriglobales bacterium]
MEKGKLPPQMEDAEIDRAAIKSWLEASGYKHIPAGNGVAFDAMPPGTFSFRTNVPVRLEASSQTVNIPIDAASRARQPENAG